MSDRERVVYYGDEGLLREVLLRHGVGDGAKYRDDFARDRRVTFRTSGGDLDVTVIYMKDRSIVTS